MSINVSFLSGTLQANRNTIKKYLQALVKKDQLKKTDRGEAHTTQKNSGLPKFTYSLFLSLLPIFKKYFWNTISDREKEIAEWLSVHHFALYQYLGTRPVTLNHNDFRLDNVFFDRENNDIAVIDWSGACKGPVGYDPAYVNMSAGNTPYTVEQIRDLATVYYQGLVQGEVTDYSLDDFLNDYRHAQLMAYRAMIIIVGSLEMEKNQKWPDWHACGLSV